MDNREQKQLSKTEGSTEEEKTFRPVVSESKISRLSKTSCKPISILKDEACVNEELKKLLRPLKNIYEVHLEFLDRGVTFNYSGSAPFN